MKVVHQMRNQQPWQQDKSAGPLPIFLGAAIAFGIGLLGVSGIIRVPTLLQTRTQIVTVAPREAQPATVVIDAASHRLGKAENAALLKTCAPLSQLGVGGAVDHGHLYRTLQTASSMSRVAAMTGIAQKSNDTVQIAAIWADVADCVYRQNGWMLCDPDNRALAAEAASAFIRQLSTAEKAEQFVENRKFHPGLSGDRRIHALQNAVAVRSRVLLSIRAQLAEGRLTATDFGMLAPSEITQIARETKVTRDACAGRN